MKFQARLPILVRGIPRGKRAFVDIMASAERSVEIPEFSRLDVAPVLSTKWTIEPRGGRHGRRSLVVLHDGCLYRRLDRIDALKYGVNRHLSRSAYPHLPVENCLTYRQHHSWRSVIGPIIRHHRWWLDLQTPSRAIPRWTKAWPPERSSRELAWHFSRAEVRWESAIEHLAHVDAASLAEAFEVCDRQLRKLISVEGTVFYRCRPPAIAVMSMPCDPALGANRPDMQVMTMPEHVDADLTRRYFELGDHESAAGYAEQLVRRSERARTGGPPPGHRLRVPPSFEAFAADTRLTHQADALPPIDTASDLAERTGATLATFLHKDALFKTHRYDEASTSARLVLTATDMLRGCNPLMETTCAFEPILDALHGVWVERGRPHRHEISTGFGSNGCGLMEDILRTIENRPVTVEF